MAAIRTINAESLLLRATVIDWEREVELFHPNTVSVRQVMAERGLESARFVQLRWITHPRLGAMREAFRVWRRPALRTRPVEEIDPRSALFSVFSYSGRVLLAFRRSHEILVTVHINAISAGMAFAHLGSVNDAVVDVQDVQPGTQTLTFSGPRIVSISFPPGTQVLLVHRLDPEYITADEWELVEHVGLPVLDDWPDLTAELFDQGLSDDLTTPSKAALDRFRRGAPFVGWRPTIAPGSAAPAWIPAHPEAMLEIFQQHLLRDLHEMVASLPPTGHQDFQVEASLDSPSGGEPALAKYQPMNALLLGAVTDPLASLLSGYGTAIDDQSIDDDDAVLRDPSRSDWDFMVTVNVQEEPGIDPIEYAAVVFAPERAWTPPVPTGMKTEADGLRSPPGVDRAWQALTRILWDKQPDELPVDVGSYALLRTGVTPASAPIALMDKRTEDPGGALQPISATSAVIDGQTKLSALDEHLAIDAGNTPNRLRYSLAQQNIFGLWSAWGSRTHEVSEPPVRHLDILSTRVIMDSPLAEPVSGALEVDIAWDWTSRSALHIDLVSRLFPQARLNDSPPVTSPAAAFQHSLTDETSSALKLVFTAGGAADGRLAADTVPSPLTVSVRYMSTDPVQISHPPGPADSPQLSEEPILIRGLRRYRITIAGLRFDFDRAARIGVALWARATEARAPQRTGPWNTRPRIASVADPRPPRISAVHDRVELASLPDPQGRCHATLRWSTVTSAQGYFFYCAAEDKLRADLELEPRPRSLTLSERLSQLRNAFAVSPRRRAFTRVNARPFVGSTYPIVLERGNQEIHLFIVLAVSAGQVESAWPTAGTLGIRDQLQAFAAPQVVTPLPPILEVTQIRTGPEDSAPYAARIRIRNEPTPLLARVDVHRVRVPAATRALDTMGPPAYRLTGTTGTFSVPPLAETEASQPLAELVGVDELAGSWRPVFYRVAVWSTADPERGLLANRSAGSALREVLIPPAEPPQLSALVLRSTDPPSGDVFIQARLRGVPPDGTVAGPHRAVIEIMRANAEGQLAVLFQWPNGESESTDSLAEMPTAPPGAGENGAWRSAGVASDDVRLHALIRREPTSADTLHARLRITDPLGRHTEQLLDIPGLVDIPAPDITDVIIKRIGDKGYRVRFLTGVPVGPPPTPQYQLQVDYTRGFVIGPIDRRPRQHLLSEIKKSSPLDDRFADRDAIVIRRSATQPSRRTEFIVHLPGNGTHVRLILKGPDGETVSIDNVLNN